MSVIIFLENTHLHIYGLSQSFNVNDYVILGRPHYYMPRYQLTYKVRELDSRFFIGRVAELG